MPNTPAALFRFLFVGARMIKGVLTNASITFLLNVFCPSFPMARTPFYHFLPKRFQSDREHRGYRRDLQFLRVIRISVSIPVVNHPQTQAPIACGIILSI